MQKTPSFFQALCLALTAAAVILLIVVFGGLVIFPTPEALLAALTSEEIWFAVQLSLITAVISTFCCVAAAVPVAYIMTRKPFAGKRWVNILLNLPLSLPPLVAGVALLIFLSPVTSPVGQFLSGFGIFIVYTPIAIVIAQFFVNLPYMIRIARSTFTMISPRYEHVARTLGCSEWRAFSQVTLPKTKNINKSGIDITL
ncbi:MAG: ABC transporter permease subunit [Methanocorpusculum sp.]|nr:ABC transporter permease subunit [Methanocorpusculum sp.]